MSESGDISVLDYYRSGDHERAMRLLMSLHQEQLYSHIHRMVGSRDETDDLLQRTFIKAWKGLDTFREESRIWTWLYRIATNECSTHLEKRNRTRMTILDESSAGFSDSPSPSPTDIEQRLKTAMDKLPPKQRSVFVLRYFDEMSYAEMAEVTSTSVGALKASYHHAVKKIEEFLTAD